MKIELLVSLDPAVIFVKLTNEDGGIVCGIIIIDEVTPKGRALVQNLRLLPMLTPTQSRLYIKGYL